MGLTLLDHVALPLKFWDHSFSTTVYFLNRLPTSGLPNYVSPFSTVHNKKPDYHSLKIFRCACFPHLRHYNKHKLELRSPRCAYLGVSPTHKVHKCMNMEGIHYKKSGD